MACGELNRNLKLWNCCRFCLETDTNRLTEIFIPVLTHNSITTVNTTIKQMLQLLHLKISPNDGCPNWICRTCRKLLLAVQYFIAQAKASKLRFEEITISNEQHELQSLRCGVECEVLYTGSDVASKVQQATIDCVDEFQQMDVDDIKAERSADDSQDSIVEEAALDDQNERYYEWLDEQNVDDIDADANKSTTSVASCDEEDTQNLVEAGSGAVTLSIEKAEVIPSFPNEKKYAAGLKLCPICGKRSSALLVHMRSHTNVRPYKCDQCQRAFFSSTKLKCHKQSVHSIERNFWCDICGKSFALIKTLRVHELSHKDEKKYACTLCHKRFIFRWALAKHERTHTDEKPFPCNYKGCEKQFKSSSNLRQHEKTHLNPNERTVNCNICGEVVRNVYALKIHKNMQHNIQRAICVTDE